MKFERTSVCNIENALRGMRNPLDSWAKSDSRYENGVYIIGEADMSLCRRLIAGGSEHRKFLRQIFVSVDITAPVYWWSEFDTYKVGTAANSRSTMHTLSKYPIGAEMFEIDGTSDTPYWNFVVAELEKLRLKYLETKDYAYFRLLKQCLPSSFLQMRTVTLNYENIVNIRRQRCHHRLREWSEDFIAWTDSLPYHELLVDGGTASAE